jgi:hypothetical protein
MPMQESAVEHEDVFVSYAREDAAVAAKLANYLKTIGISVFWDADIRNGEDFHAKLDTKLGGVRCVLVLWSQNSINSDWVLNEADFGKSRQVLVAARLDDCQLPVGFRRLNADDLTNWLGDTPPSGLFGVITRIRELLEAPRFAAEKDKQPLSRQPGQESISDRERDKAALVEALPDFPEAVISVENGYHELNNALQAAKSVLSNTVSRSFYGAAAEHFGQALEMIGNARLRPARDKRAVEYFLRMERANALVYSVRGVDNPIAEAIGIYRSLANNAQYKRDVPVYFRWGCALVKQSRTEQSLTEAIQRLRRARKLAAEVYDSPEPSDELLNEGTWLKIEIAKQLGFCNYEMSRLPATPLQKRKKYLEDAIQETREAVSAARLIAAVPSEYDDDSFTNFTVLKAQGNLIFLLAERIRNGKAQAGDDEEIRKLIGEIKQPAEWAVAQNQVHIIDDIAFGAATIGDWQTAFEEADRNVDNFASLAVPNGLPADELAMEARASEIRFFTNLLRQRH